MSAAEPAYLLLAGTTKAATTSLFAWLAAHPRVAPARIKETRYFLDADYPLAPSVPHGRGFAVYAAQFEARAGGAVRLEATPDYLHSPGTAARIRRELPEARVVFSLRDPCARLLSWYRFARAGARLAAGESFEAWIRRQQRQPGGAQHDRALAQGRYGADLARYFELFPRAHLHVLFHEELESQPQATMRALCAFAGLAPEFYDDFAFTRHNESRSARHPRVERAYQRLAFHARRWTVGVPPLFALLRRTQRSFAPVFRRWNAGLPEAFPLSPALAHELEEFYAPDVRALEALLGRPVPWPRFAARAAEVPHAR